MKEYLQKFRAQAFEGSMSLFKRILVSNFILNVITTLIILAVMVPLLLKTFGWQIADMMNFKEKMQQATVIAQTGGDPADIFRSIFDVIDPFYLCLMIIIGICIYCWMINVFLKLNDNEVRSGNRNFVSALSSSFSGNILSILGFLLVYSILYSIVILVFMFLIVMLVSVSKVMGVLLGFIGFFVIVILMLRFSLGLPAIVHGRMNIADAISFSFKHITMKRAGLIFLFALILAILAGILSVIINMIVLAIIGKDGGDTITALIVQQVLSSVSGAIIGAFIYAAMTALYFRYSSDETGEQDVKDHLVM
jgi:hypothetical protein